MENIGIYVAPILVFFISFLFSMLGMGGSQLYTPIFYWFGFDFKSEAVPAGLLLNFITLLSATTTYIKYGLVKFKTAISFIPIIFIMAPIGAYFTKWIHNNVIIFLFGLFTIVVSIQTLSGKSFIKGEVEEKKKILIGIVAGVLIGLLVGIIGRGGGCFVMPTLLAIGLEPKNAAATSSFIVCFSSFSGFLGHLSVGHIKWKLTIFCSVSVLLGSQLGSRVMARKIKGQLLKKIFSVVLIAVAITLFKSLI
jgi:hypothetical protein